MHDLFEASRKTKQPLTAAGFAAAVKKYLPEDITPKVDKYLINGDLIMPPRSLGGVAELATVEMRSFELGFDFDRFAKEKVVDGVKPDSAAYDAGLRNGQTRASGFSVFYGDTEREIELKVKDAEGEKTVKFVPASKQPIAVPQYKKLSR
jgi:predicted metalloprotease with PDZ domain